MQWRWVIVLLFRAVLWKRALDLEVNKFRF